MYARAPWPLPDDVRVVDISGYPLAIRESGEGMPLLFLHGSLSDYRTWAGQIDHFSTHYRAVAPSLRHHYPEPWDGDGGTFSLDRHAADIVELIQLMEWPSVHLVGHSRGGAVALTVASRILDTVRSLTLADPRGLGRFSPEASSADDAGFTRALFAQLKADLRTGEPAAALRNFVNTLNGADAWERRPPEMRAMMLANIATAVDSGEPPDLSGPDLARFRFPILALTGERSPARYREEFAAMRRWNEYIAPPVVLAGADHSMHRANPAGFNAALARFLNSVDDGDGTGRQA